ELDVAERDVERLALTIVHRQADAEAHVGAVAERRQFPGLVVDAEAERADADVAGDVEGKARLGVDADVGVDLQAAAGHPVDVYAGFGRAFDAERAADLQAAGGAGAGDT